MESQFLDFLKELHTPTSLEEWILKYINFVDKENELFSEDKKTNLNKTLNENQKQIEEVNRMRYRNFLNDDEFLEEKAKLLQEKQSLQTKLKNIDSQNSNLGSMMTKTLNFTQNAAKWFQSAQPEQKRLIMEVVGSNLILKDKILLIQAHKPFQIADLVKNQETVEKVWFEPLNFSELKQKIGALSNSYPTWLGGTNDVRTF